MRRSLRVVRLVSVATGVVSLALTGIAPGITAGESGEGSVLVPPFAAVPPVEASSIRLPCTEVPVPRQPLPSLPEDGRVRADIGVQATGCEALAYSRTEVWTLGGAPAGLVGKPVLVRAVVEGVSFVGHGEGDGTVGGTVSMRIGSSPPWSLGAFECRAGTCNPPTPAPGKGPLVLETRLDALPAGLDGQFRSEVFVREGSGKATLRFEALLVSVVVTAVGESG